MPLKADQIKNEQELRRRAAIAVRQLGYNSLRAYELAKYQEAIQQASQKVKNQAARS